MAIVYAGERAASKVTGGSGTSQALTLSTGCSAGNTVILSFGARATSLPTVTVTDSRSNTWTVDSGPLIGSNNLCLVASTRQNTATLQSGDTITVDFGAVTPGQARIWMVEEFSGLATSSYLNVTDDGTAASGTSVTTGTTAATDTNDELVMAACCYGSGVPSFTKDGTYSAFTTTYQNCVADSDGFNKSLGHEYKIVASTGTQEATATLSASTSWQIVLATYRIAGSGSKLGPLLGVG